MTTTALVVIDMQTDLLSVDGRLPVDHEQAKSALSATNAAIGAARERGLPVAYVVNAFSPWSIANPFRKWCCIRGRPGSELDPRLTVVDEAPRFDKWRGDAFCNEELSAWLREADVSRLAVAGVQANACVLATVRGGMRHGFHETVLQDAVADRSERARTSGLDGAESSGATARSVEEWIEEDLNE